MKQLMQLPNGHGGIILLGGQLEWNPDACRRDCPYPGSLFYFGNLRSGPAQEDVTHG